MNVITIAGNLTKDADLRFLPTGDAVANFTIADNQGKDKAAIFWNCGLFGKRGQTLAPYLTKGSAVTVTGEVSERKFTDKDGIERKAQDVRVQNVALQGGRQQQSAPADDVSDVPF